MLLASTLKVNVNSLSYFYRGISKTYRQTSRFVLSAEVVLRLVRHIDYTYDLALDR